MGCHSVFVSRTTVHPYTTVLNNSLTSYVQRIDVRRTDLLPSVVFLTQQAAGRFDTFGHIIRGFSKPRLGMIAPVGMIVQVGRLVAHTVHDACGDQTRGRQSQRLVLAQLGQHVQHPLPRHCTKHDLEHSGFKSLVGVQNLATAFLFISHREEDPKPKGVVSQCRSP